jgi:hypothetical protein
MQKILSLFICLNVFICSGQSTNPKAETNKVTNAAYITSLKAGRFSFPIIKLLDKVKTERINNYLVNAALGEEFTVNNLKSELEKQSKKLETSYSGLSDLSYKIVYNNPKILSVSISSCWTGNRETCDDVQFNFDLTTGYNFGLDQILIPSKKYEIKRMMIEELKKRLQKSKVEMKRDGQWSQDYETSIKEEVINAETQLDVSGFKLSEKGISFLYYSMPFAMAIREYFPSQEYFYSWATLKPYLMPSSPISHLVR